MNNKEFSRLLAFQQAKKRAFHPAVSVTSRRSSKHPSVGKVFKSSRVVSDTGLETCLNAPGWVREKQR